MGSQATHQHHIIMALITLPNGTETTLREQFIGMPPKKHDPNPDKSEVIQHIIQTLGCDLERARRAFDSIRCADSRVILFDRVGRVWHGAEWLSGSTDENHAKANRRQLQMTKSIDVIKDQLRRLQGDVLKMSSKRRKGGSDEALDLAHQAMASIEEIDGKLTKINRSICDIETAIHPVLGRVPTKDEFNSLLARFETLLARHDSLEHLILYPGASSPDADTSSDSNQPS